MKKKLLILLFLASLTTYAQTNLVPNGGFETWTNSTTLSNWATQNNVTQNTSNFTEGSKSAKLSISYSTVVPKIIAQVPMTAGATYTVKFKYKYVNTNYNGQHPIALNISQNGSATTLSSSTFATDNNWTVKETTFTPDQNMSYDLSISLFTFDGAAFDVNIDAVQVYLKGTEQYTLIPDVNFENKLITMGIDSGVADGKVLTNDINKLTNLDVSLSSIANLTGIEDFVSLTYLNCNYNQLTALDISKMDNLTNLNSASNQLTALDVSKNIALKNFSCNQNKLVTLDVSKNVSLTDFSCANNQLTSLDLSHNLALKTLGCYYNQLTSVDVSKNQALNKFQCYNNQLNALDVSKNLALNSFGCSNNKLTTLDVSKNLALADLSCDNNKLTALDVSANVALITFYCAANQLTTLDVSKNVALKNFLCAANQLTTLDVSKNVALSSINCPENQLTTLDVSKNLALKQIHCYSNKITSLDVSKNVSLKDFNCSGNKLTSIDVSKNVALAFLYCQSNQLRSLNVSKNPLLTELNCSNNMLWNLNLKNGNNFSLNMTYSHFYGNQFLTCIQVDDADYSSNYWTNAKDFTANYNVDCTEYTLIPDPNFEQKLIDLGIDTDGLNGKISNTDANPIGALDLSSSTISDLTGISAFKALITLNCAKNKLTTLDISNNNFLIELDCQDNQLTSLNLNNYNNSGFITKNSRFTNNPNLTCIQVDDAIYSNANWSSIKDDTANFNTDCSTSNLYTYIPDVNFEKKLISLGIDSGFADGKVLTVNVASLTSLDVSNSNISNLAGIENFTSLNKLDCGYNKLSTLNVSNSKNLNELSCRYNDLTALDVSANTNLTSLDCIFNHITALDVSNLLALTSLLCVDNKLTNLDLTKNLYLDWFSCNSNQLTTLDVYQNKILRYLDCGFNQLTSLDVSNNLSIFYLNCYHNKLTSIDVSMLTELTTLACSENQFSSFDVSKNVKLSSLLCENINVSTLDLSNNTALTELYCGNNEQLTTLDLSKNKKLTTFLCFNNHLTDLNIKNGTNTLLVDVDFRSNSTLTCIQVDDETYSNTNWASKKDITASYSTNCTSYTLIPDSNFEQKLIDLGIDTDGLNGKVHISKINTLTSLDVSNSGIKSLEGIEDFVDLDSLNCSSNQLSSLDVSKNEALRNFSCNSNQLTYLNLKNGNNSNFNTISFIDNPKLSCILVDDSDYSNANWSDKKDNTASYNTKCIAYTLILDSSFEQKLIDLGIDTDGLNGKISTTNINSITSLDLSNSNITDMTGIQDFVALTYLDCNTNNIKTIDVSNNKLLTKLALYDNQLTNLDVTKNTQLLNFECSNNQISSIDLSQNTKLFHLGIGHNKLSNLDISANLDLQSISCYENNLTSLDIKNHTALIALECGLNNITSLDLSTNTKLESLGCYNMQLTALDLTTNVPLKRLSAGSNQLTTLDLSKNEKLELVFLEFNPLTSLNIQNGNNKNFILPSATGKTTTNLYCSFANNGKLGCIKVDDEAYSNAKWANIKDATATYSSTCSKLGIEDSVFDKVGIFPNPTKGELHIDNIVLKKATVYDVLGKLVKTTTFTSGAKDNTMHLTGLPKGIYYIYLESEGANTAKKIIVE